MRQLLLAVALMAYTCAAWPVKASPAIESSEVDSGAMPEEVPAEVPSMSLPDDDMQAETSLSTPEPPAPTQEPKVGYAAVTVRLTYYTISGITYGGGRTYSGSAACSWNFRLGTRFRFPHGEIVTCNDRGMLGSAGWLDVYGYRPDLPRRYGNYVTVEVIP